MRLWPSFYASLTCCLMVFLLTPASAQRSDKQDRPSPVEALQSRLQQVRDDGPRLPPLPFRAPSRDARPEINWDEVQAKFEADRENARDGLRSVQDDLAAGLPRLSRPELNAVLMPVLIPAAAEVDRDSLAIIGQPDAYSATGALTDGTALRISGSRKKLVLEEPPRVLEKLKQLRAEKPELPSLEAAYIITRSESSTDLSFSRFGCGYVLSLVCDDPNGDERCAGDEFIMALADSLQLLLDREKIRFGDATALPDRHQDNVGAETEENTSQPPVVSETLTGNGQAALHVDAETSLEVTLENISAQPKLLDDLGNSFSFLPVGDLLPQSGPGFEDNTVYRDNLTFPTEERAFLNSQVYRYGGYYGSLNDMQGGQCAPENFSYPWQDTFCEKRSRQQKLCPGGGHEGLDIRPATCTKDKHWAVSVEATRVVDIRRHWVTLQSAEGTIYNYLHLNMSDLSVEIGDTLVKGQRIGRISNDFFKSDGSSVATTIHLHFEMYENYVGDEEEEPFFTKVNPYATLVFSYRQKHQAKE
ncbi:MAG: M23 family metallopeptidase [Aquisalinus sp.]|nr:M23 family metallopeptidase [Aquisalinus sp.]